MSTENGTNGNGNGVEIKTAWGSISAKRSAEIISMLLAIGVGIMGWMLYVHVHDARDASKLFVEAVKEMTAAQRETAQGQREMNCLISQPQDRRDVELCKRIAR